MRRFIIGALTAFGTLTLAVAPATAQYVDQPGETPQVGSAGFGAQSAEVLGESVTRSDSAGIAGQPAEVQTAEVAGVEASRGETAESVREAGTSRAASARSGTSVLAYTGIYLAVMVVAGGLLLGIGSILRRYGRPQTA